MSNLTSLSRRLARLVGAFALILSLVACADTIHTGSPDSDLDTRDAPNFDLVVYGGTSAGVAAAVQGGRMGASVLLIEPTQHLGGLSSGGLGATDIGNKAAIGGIAREFYQRVRAHYATDDAWVRERREEFAGHGHRPDDDAAWTFEPHVAERIFEAMVAEAGIEVLRGERLELGPRGVVRDSDARLRAIRLEGGGMVRGRAFIDASYEGDLLAAAGVDHHVGREPESQYGESANGVRVTLAVHHQFTHDVDPYVVPGDPSSGLLPFVQAGGPGIDGEGDVRVQAYCFRLCATDVAANRRPWPKPADYDASRYELLFRNFEAGDRRRPWHPLWMPNRKTDANNNFAISTDHIGGNWEYPTADYATRERIVADHVRYQQGLMWSLANHPRVPAEIREYFSGFGLARDEFVENGNWPRQLYVREARRMVSDVVMTEAHCRGERTVEDPVGLAAYSMDSHHVQRYVDERGFCRNEGDVQIHGIRPYGISLRAILAPREHSGNLAVPVCLSASHIAFGSIRMEPVFMVLGQSAATVLCLALQSGVAAHDLDYATLRTRLEADGQVLVWSR